MIRYTLGAIALVLLAVNLSPARSDTYVYVSVASEKRIAGIVFNCVNEIRAKKYGGEYYHGKSYEKYYSE